MVRSVVRKGIEAVHFVESSDGFEPGEEVIQKLDWPRRFDHMQQHLGQHLITALFDREYGMATGTWWLGSETSYIELETKDVTQQQLENIEQMANDLIIEGRKVTVTVTSAENLSKFENVRAPRALPSDHVGPVTIISIEGVEHNMCCGTHVKNLSQLQAVKLLSAEKSKQKVYIHFLIGNRVIRKLTQSYNHELQLNNILKGGPSMHLELIQKTQNNLKTTRKTFLKVLKDLAIFETDKIKSLNPEPKFYSLHRADGIEIDFINTFLKAAPKGVFYFLSVWDSSTKGAGHMVLQGEPELISKFGPLFMDLLDGKGNGKANCFQGKVKNFNKISACETELRDHFKV